MIRTVTCVVVECDDCKDAYWENGDFGGIPHWKTVEEAIQEMAGDGDAEDPDEYAWVFLDGGHVVCPYCWTARICAAEGHEFLPPMPCRCQGRNAEHAENGCPDWQLCGRCNHREPVS
jgi:hypothetical protein